VRWCPDGDFLRPAFPASRMQHISDMHSKFTLSHTMCRSMVDIQSVTAEIRRGKKRKIEITGQKYNVRICDVRRPQLAIYYKECHLIFKYVLKTEIRKMCS